MVTVNSLPNFVIQTNGSAPYVLKTISYTGILKMVEIESKDDSTINIDLRDIEFEGVKIKGNSDIGRTTLEWVRWSMANQNWPVVIERPLTCADALKELYSNELQFLVNKGYVISGFVPGAIHIESMTIEGPRDITEAGTYDYYIIPTPANANDYNIQVFTPGNVTPVIDPNDPFHITITVDKNNNGDFAFTAVDTVSTNSATLNGHIYIPSVIEDITFDIAPDIVGYDTPTAFGVNIIGPSDAQYDLEWSIVDGDRYNRVTIEKTDDLGAVININSQYFPKYDDDITIKVRDKVSGIEKTVTVHAKTEARLVIEGPTEINESGFYQYHAYMKYMSQGEEKTWGKEEQIYLADYYVGISISTSTKTRNRMTVAEGVEIDQEVILRSETDRVSAIPTLEPYVAEPYIVQVDTLKLTGLCITNTDTEALTICIPQYRLTNPQISIDGATWTSPVELDIPVREWEYSRIGAVLQPGQSLYIKADKCVADQHAVGRDRPDRFVFVKSFIEITHWGDAEYVSGSTAVSGNIMSLCGFSKSMEGNSFVRIFSLCDKMTSAPNLPATTLSDYCYEAMFSMCTSLRSIPYLNATNLTVECYRGMFYGCTSLTSATLPSNIELASGCYRDMFDGCTNLERVYGSLPAVDPVYNCYSGMFRNCTSLRKAPEIYLSYVPEVSCINEMFFECASLEEIRVHADWWFTMGSSLWTHGVSPTGTFYKPSGTTIPIREIPDGWTVVNF